MDNMALTRLKCDPGVVCISVIVPARSKEEFLVEVDNHVVRRQCNDPALCVSCQLRSDSKMCVRMRRYAQEMRRRT